MVNSQHEAIPFSETHPQAVYSLKTKTRKAATIVRVLRDYFGPDLSLCSVLDVGCSTGIIAGLLSEHVQEVYGIDRDEPAIRYAKRNFQKDTVTFHVASAMDMPFPDRRFHVVICAHIYEHVSNPAKMMAEIHRVLKPKGVCYFAAGNRINLMEPHHRLPFLSVLPRPLAHIYMRASGKGSRYPEKHLSYWGLRRLIREFYRIDYTRKIIEQAAAFSAEYMIQPDTLKARFAGWIVRHAYWLCPGYVWLLRKDN